MRTLYEPSLLPLMWQLYAVLEEKKNLEGCTKEIQTHKFPKSN